MKKRIAAFIVLLVNVLSLNAQSNDMSIKDFVGTWYTRDKSQKMEIKKNKITSYFLSSESNAYEKMFEEPITGVEYKRLKGKSEHGFGMFAYIEKDGNLLSARIAVTDVDMDPILFARDEADFPPLPVYVGKGGAVKDRTLKSFSLSLNAFRDTVPLPKIDALKDKKEISMYMTNLGESEKKIRFYADLKESKYASSFSLTPELEAKLVNILLEPGALKTYQFKERNTMMAPLIRVRLNVQFASGELIEISESYGYMNLPSETAYKIVELLLNAARK